MTPHWWAGIRDGYLFPHTVSTRHLNITTIGNFNKSRMVCHGLLDAGVPTAGSRNLGQRLAGPEPQSGRGGVNLIERHLRRCRDRVSWVSKGSEPDPFLTGNGRSYRTRKEAELLRGDK